jgi:hypothetical protein
VRDSQIDLEGNRVPVILAEEPMLCVANGAGRYFEHAKDAASSKTIYNNLNSKGKNAWSSRFPEEE